MATWYMVRLVTLSALPHAGMSLRNMRMVDHLGYQTTYWHNDNDNDNE